MLTPPAEYLEGSPFDTYLVPGLVLGLVLGGVHAAALVAQSRRASSAPLWSAAAGFEALIWIFVQMCYIPFSLLQVVYFAVGIAETGLVMLALGILRPDDSRIPSLIRRPRGSRDDAE